MSFPRPPKIETALTPRQTAPSEGPEAQPAGRVCPPRAARRRRARGPEGCAQAELDPQGGRGQDLDGNPSPAGRTRCT